MRSPLFPIADLVLQKLESDILNKFVDDIALATPCTYLEDLLHMFNSFHPRLKFTMIVGKWRQHIKFFRSLLDKKR